MNTMHFRALAACALAATLSIAQPAIAAPDRNSPSFKFEGAAFVMTNQAEGNQIVSYGRSSNGTLTRVGVEPTGGQGIGLSSDTRGMLRLSPDRETLYAANTGSGDISVLRVQGTRLRPLQVIDAGERPVSLAVSESLLYAVDDGAVKAITGFRIASDGSLAPIPGSFRRLSSPYGKPGEIQFSPDGSTLLVTVRSTDPRQPDLIDAFTIAPDGTACLSPVRNESIGSTPYSLAFSNEGTLLVVENYGVAPEQSGVTAYQLNAGTVTPIGSVANNQADVQSVAIHGESVYTASFATGNVSTYRLEPSGQLWLTNASAGSFGASSQPTDLALSPDGQFLYQLLRGGGSVGVMMVTPGAPLWIMQRLGTQLPASTPLAAMVVF